MLLRAEGFRLGSTKGLTNFPMRVHVKRANVRFLFNGFCNNKVKGILGKGGTQGSDLFATHSVKCMPALHKYESLEWSFTVYSKDGTS